MANCVECDVYAITVTKITPFTLEYYNKMYLYPVPVGAGFRLDDLAKFVDTVIFIRRMDDTQMVPYAKVQVAQSVEDFLKSVAEA